MPRPLRRPLRRLLLGLSAAALTAGVAAPASAQFLRGGFTTTPMPRGDDNWAPSFYGFDINYFGGVSDAGVVCTNGYVILNFFVPSGATCAFPGPLSGTSVPNLNGLRDFYGSALVPYFSDLRTNFPTNQGGQIQVGTGMVDGNMAWSATWDAVRGYASGTGTFTTSTFQAVLVSLNEAGDFRLEFNYGTLGWFPEGGVGFVDDGGFSGTPFVRNVTVPPEYAGAGFMHSRYSCDFIGGSPVNCAFVSAVPEPATVVLFGSGMVALFGVAGWRQRRRTAA